VTLWDNLAAAGAYTVTAGTISRSGFGGLTYDATTEDLTLRAGAGNDTFAINSTAADTTLTVFAGAGNDTARLAGASGKLSNLAGTVRFYAGAGSDSITLSDQQAPAAGAYLVRGTFVSWEGSGLLLYSGTENLALNGTSFGDTFNVSPSQTTLFTLDGGNPTPVAGPPGDTLTLNLAGTTSPVLTVTPDPSGDQGSWTFANRRDVLFHNMETLGPAADLAVTLSAPPTAAEAGQVTYTITVTNNGPGFAAGVALTDVLPPGTVFSSASFSQGTTSFQSGVLTAQLGSLPSGASATGTIVLTVTEDGTLANTVGIASLVSDTIVGNNSQTATTAVSDPAVHTTGGFTVSALEGTDSGGQAVATFTDPPGPRP
jgi:uncharacterized repeat protein (TIGR01451 family)